MSNHLSTCTFCGVGCGIYLETQRNEITGVYPSMSHPANHGRICVRGWHVHEIASASDRLTTPLIRKNGTLTPVTFTEAYDYIAQRLTKIKKEYGPDSIGFLDSARCANEDGYLFQKFARSVIGTNNVDQGTSLYRTTTVEVMRRMVGIPAATNPSLDIFNSKVIILNEIDIGQQLPTIGGQIIRAKLGGAKLIVVGERRHRVAEHADIFLNTKPGTSVFLYAAMAKIIIDRGLINLDFIRSRCQGYAEFLANIQSFDILLAARQCDIEPALIEQAALLYAQNAPGRLFYAAGSEDLSEDTLSAMINLVLLTGNLGKPGAGIIPLAEHNNAQGGNDMGVTPRYLPGYAPVDDIASCERFKKHWGTSCPAKPGISAEEMLAANTPIKALWLDRHNPIVASTFSNAAESIKKMELVVLQNLFMTKTAELAHVVLPVAAYGEEDVTFTNTERRVQRAVKVVNAPANLPSAWQQITEVARRMGALWPYATSSDVLKEIADTIPQYSAITVENLSREYGRQWPCTHDNPLGTPILFTHRAANQFNFAPVHPSIENESFSSDYPLILSFGHSLYYWHQNTLVRHSVTLKREYGILLLDYPDGFVEINPDDAKTLTLRDGQPVKLVSADGSMNSFARITNEVRHGTVYVPFFLQDTLRSLRKESSGKRGTYVHVRIEKAA